MEQKPIKIEYIEPDIGQAPSTDVNLEQVFGNIPQVSTVPTWVPKLFKDGFAYYKSGGTMRLYVYDYVNNAWRYAALT